MEELSLKVVELHGVFYHGLISALTSVELKPYLMMMMMIIIIIIIVMIIIKKFIM